jgi:hypothetical protein
VGYTKVPAKKSPPDGGHKKLMMAFMRVSGATFPFSAPFEVATGAS